MHTRAGAQNRADPNVMGLTSLGLEIGIFCDFLYSVLLLSVALGLDFLGLALVPTSGKSKSQQIKIATRPKSVSKVGTPRFPGRTPSPSSPAGLP